MRLYDTDGRRLYINAAERERFLVAARSVHRDIRSFGLTLLYTGCRISEALALSTGGLQLSDTQTQAEALAVTMDGKFKWEPIWQFHWEPVNRSTAYRWIKFLMNEAEIYGVHASPKGLRHGYAIHALQCGVPLNMLQKWMGHADIETTAIYGNACGPEERRIAERMW